MHNALLFPRYRYRSIFDIHKSTSHYHFLRHPSMRIIMLYLYAIAFLILSASGAHFMGENCRPSEWTSHSQQYPILGFSVQDNVNRLYLSIRGGASNIPDDPNRSDLMPGTDKVLVHLSIDLSWIWGKLTDRETYASLLGRFWQSFSRITKFPDSNLKFKRIAVNILAYLRLVNEKSVLKAFHGPFARAESFAVDKGKFILLYIENGDSKVPNIASIRYRNALANEFLGKFINDQFIFVMGATEHSQFKKLAKSFSANSKESFPLFAVVAPAEAPYKSEALTVLSLAPYEITAESVFRFLQTSLKEYRDLLPAQDGLDGENSSYQDIFKNNNTLGLDSLDGKIVMDITDIASSGGGATMRDNKRRNDDDDASGDLSFNYDEEDYDTDDSRNQQRAKDSRRRGRVVGTGKGRDSSRLSSSHGSKGSGNSRGASARNPQQNDEQRTPHRNRMHVFSLSKGGENKEVGTTITSGENGEQSGDTTSGGGRNESATTIKNGSHSGMRSIDSYGIITDGQQQEESAGDLYPVIIDPSQRRDTVTVSVITKLGIRMEQIFSTSEPLSAVEAWGKRCRLLSHDDSEEFFIEAPMIRFRAPNMLKSLKELRLPSEVVMVIEKKTRQTQTLKQTQTQIGNGRGSDNSSKSNGSSSSGNGSSGRRRKYFPPGAPV